MLLTLGKLVLWVGRQSRIHHPTDRGVIFQEQGQSVGVSNEIPNNQTPKLIRACYKSKNEMSRQSYKYQITMPLLALHMYMCHAA